MAHTKKLQDSIATVAHDSNPFTTSLRGIKKLLHVNPNAVIGVTLLNIVLFIFALLVLGAMFLAVAAFYANHNYMGFELLLPILQSFQASMSDSSVAVTLLLGVILLGLSGGFIQALTTKLAIDSSANKRVAVSSLIKQALPRTWSLIGLGVIMCFFVFLAIVALALVGQLVGPIIVIGIVAALIAAIYVWLRWTFAAFVIVEEKLGPIASLKRSWMLTKGHMAEVVGITAVALLIVIIPSSMVDLSNSLIDNTTLSSILMLISNIVGLLSSILCLSAIAERYHQLRGIADKHQTAQPVHMSNFLAVVAVVVLLPPAMVISSSASNSNPFFEPYAQQQRHNNSSNDSYKFY